MNEAKTRAKIKELHAVAVQWGAKADRAVRDKHPLDAQQHLRRARELVLEAARLEATLNAD